MMGGINGITEVWRTNSQREVLESGILTTGFNCVLQMPTGSGKTWLAEHAIEDALRKGFRAIYLTPLKALATEIREKWANRFGDHKVGVFTGDFGSTGEDFPVSFKDARVLVMTPERFDACGRAWRAHWHWIPEVDLVIADEFHLLGDGHRGARLEGAIDRFRRLNPFARVHGLSATLGNRTELANWMDGIEFHSTHRPIELKWKQVRFGKADEKPKLLLDECLDCITQGGKTIVFVQSRRRAETLAKQLADNGLRSLHHHAGLARKKRLSVEQNFRDGELDVLVATPTLEMGVNLPARRVILYDLQHFDGQGFSPLSVTKVWQRVGRAGRPGLDDIGEAVLFSPTWDRSSHDYPSGKFEPVQSQLSDKRFLAEQIVAETTGGFVRNRWQLNPVFSRYLGSKQGRLGKLEEVTDEMLEAGILTDEPSEGEDPDKPILRVTPLGRTACRQMLLPSTVLLFSNFLNKIPNPTPFDLCLVACCSEDCQPLIPADFEELAELERACTDLPSEILKLENFEIERLLKVSGKRLLGSIKMSMIALSRTQSDCSDTVAERFGCYPFEVIRLAESLDRLFLALTWLVKRRKGPEDTQTKKVQLLGKMVTHGLNPGKATLTLVDGIGCKWAEKLSAHGIKDIQILAKTRLPEIVNLKGLSKKRAQAWKKSAQAIAKKGIEWNRTLTVRIDFQIDRKIEKGVDPYRFQRSRELVVRRVGKRHLVSGGLEPHKVTYNDSMQSCDCLDFTKGNRCKHLLAVESFLRATKANESSGPEPNCRFQELWTGPNHEQTKQLLAS